MSSFRPSAPIVPGRFQPSVSYGAVARIDANRSNAEGSTEFEARPVILVGGGRAEPAEEVVDPWTPERLEELEQAAFVRGAESARASANEFDRLLETLNSAALGLEQVASTSVSVNRDLLLGLAMEIAARWVGQELKLEPTLFGDTLDGAIRSLDEREGAVLFLNPLDHALLVEMDSERLVSWQVEHGLHLEKDDSVARAGFRLEGPGQIIDASAEAVLDRLRLAMSEMFDPASPEAAS